MLFLESHHISLCSFILTLHFVMQYIKMTCTQGQRFSGINNLKTGYYCLFFAVSPLQNTIISGMLGAAALICNKSQEFFLAAVHGIFDLNYSMWDLLPCPGLEPGTPALEARSLSHWTTREVPLQCTSHLEASAPHTVHSPTK